MRHRGFSIWALALLLLVATADASTRFVRANVTPARVIGGERLTISAHVSRGTTACSARVTGTAAANLSSRKPVRGTVSWSWTLPVSARTGSGAARVTCRPVASDVARFAIRGLPAGDPVAGKTVFLLNCGGCHTLADAGTQGTSLDLDVADPAYARVVDRVVNGKGLMSSFKSRLSVQQIADLARYVSSVAGG